GDTIYKTDLTELEDVSSLRKRLRYEGNLTLELEVSYNARELYEDLLDKGRVNLSKIPEDFDKVPGTIKRRERIKSRWKSARLRRRYTRRRTIIYIVFYAGTSSSSEARTLTKIVINNKDSLEIRRLNILNLLLIIGTTFVLPEIVYGPSLLHLARFADRKGYFTPTSSGIEVVKIGK
ncbi:hypothetical protein N7445_004237, partial [Penicillium cf. griseofulvum]